MRLLQLFAQAISGILARVAPIIKITRIAAKTEPEIAELLENILEQRFQNFASVIKHLNSLGSLREGMNESQATESIWVITSPEVYRLLLTDRGWTKLRYVDWLSDTLVRILLPRRIYWMPNNAYCRLVGFVPPKGVNSTLTNASIKSTIPCCAYLCVIPRQLGAA